MVITSFFLQLEFLLNRTQNKTNINIEQIMKNLVFICLS